MLTIIRSKSRWVVVCKLRCRRPITIAIIIKISMHIYHPLQVVADTSEEVCRHLIHTILTTTHTLRVPITTTHMVLTNYNDASYHLHSTSLGYGCGKCDDNMYGGKQSGVYYNILYYDHVLCLRVKFHWCLAGYSVLERSFP